MWLSHRPLFSEWKGEVAECVATTPSIVVVIWWHCVPVILVVVISWQSLCFWCFFCCCSFFGNYGGWGRLRSDGLEVEQFLARPLHISYLVVVISWQSLLFIYWFLQLWGLGETEKWRMRNRTVSRQTCIYFLWCSFCCAQQKVIQTCQSECNLTLAALLFCQSFVVSFCLEVTLCGWQDVTVWWLVNLLGFLLWCSLWILWVRVPRSHVEVYPAAERMGDR